MKRKFTMSSVVTLTILSGRPEYNGHRCELIILLRNKEASLKLDDMVVIYLIFVLMTRSTVNSLTCNEVLDMPPEKQLTFQELTTMSPKDINDCLVHLARGPLKATDVHFIWEALVNFYEGISNIPENVLAQLHWVTVAISPEEYDNITIASIDTVRNFGLHYNLDYSQLAAIAERVRQDFAEKRPEHYTYYDLKALNQILCAFNRSEIERIHPSAYKEAASFIGKLKNCDPDVMAGFGHLALQERAFGPLVKWTGLILRTVGSVAQYLPGGIPKDIKRKLEAERDRIDEPEDYLVDLETHSKESTSS